MLLTLCTSFVSELEYLPSECNILAGKTDFDWLSPSTDIFF